MPTAKDLIVAQWAINLNLIYLEKTELIDFMEVKTKLEKRLTKLGKKQFIENIWQGAFQDCTALETVYNDAEYPQNISGGKVFEGVDLSKCTLYVHVISRYKEADGWKEFGNIERIW